MVNTPKISFYSKDIQNQLKNLDKYHEQTCSYVYIKSTNKKQPKVSSKQNYTESKKFKNVDCTKLISHGRTAFAASAPFMLFLFFIPVLIIYHGRPKPIYTKDIYIDGFTKTRFVLCPKQGMYTKLLILVASAPGNFEKRRAVRRTWGRYVSRADVTVAFIVGQPLGQHARAIEKEDNRYRDLIVANFLDTYPNLSLKTLALLKWAQKHCSKAKFLLKADDDYFLNVPAWLAITDFNKTLTTRTVWGYYIMFINGPVRDKTSRYYISRLAFGKEKFPMYTSGGAYMMGFDCIDDLLKTAFDTPYVGSEDAFLTGIVAEKAGILRREAIYLNGISAVHPVAPREQYLLWNIFKLTGRVVTLEDTQSMSEFVTAKMFERHAWENY